MLRTHKIVRICIAECLAFLGLVSVACSVGFPLQRVQGADSAWQPTSPPSPSSVRMFQNDQINIHKLDMKSIHAYRSFSLKNYSTLSTTRHLLSQPSMGWSAHWTGMSSPSQAQKHDQGTVTYSIAHTLEGTVCFKSVQLKTHQYSTGIKRNLNLHSSNWHIWPNWGKTIIYIYIFTTNTSCFTSFLCLAVPLQRRIIQW